MSPGQVSLNNDHWNLGIGSQGLDEPRSGDHWNIGIGSQGHVIRLGEIEEGFRVYKVK